MYKFLMMTMAVFLISSYSFAKDPFAAPPYITDYDIPALRDAMKESYIPATCQREFPNADEKACDCLRDAMASNLDVKKLKLCKKAGNDECVATEFSAARSALTEEQINDCGVSNQQNRGN